jgi:hypothetical protein
MTQEVYRKVYGDATLMVTETLQGYYRSVPFSFAILWRGSTWNFPTITNRCQTRHEAIMRGWYRCQWLNNGTFFTRYR